MHRLREFYFVVVFSLILFSWGTSNVMATSIVLPSIIDAEDYLLQVESTDTVTLSGNTEISNSATLSIINYGTLIWDNLSLSTYTAVTSLVNYGVITGNNLYLKDQNDETSIVNYGSLELNNVGMAANGGTSSINFHTYGSSQIGSLSADANYGGLINIITHEGGNLVTTNFTYDASGKGLNDRPSQVNLIEMAPVPEPATMLLFSFGLLGIVGVTRRKN